MIKDTLNDMCDNPGERIQTISEISNDNIMDFQSMKDRPVDINNNQNQSNKSDRSRLFQKVSFCSCIYEIDM